MRPFSIAGVQMHVSAFQSNIDRMVERLNTLMYLFPWVEMVVFSELAPLGPLTKNAAPFPNDTEKIFQDLASRHKIWLIPGSMFESFEGRIYNTASVINPQGEVVGRHRKMFPFYPYEEGVEPGAGFLVFDVPEIGRFGVSICYDMWFPETTRTLACMGAEVIIHPSLTGTIDRQIELSIARANAAMNQCFFLDINGLGDGGSGYSILVGPAGEVLHQAGTGPELMPIELDLDRVHRSREVGLRGLGQPLKSFRDSKVDFDIYRPGATQSEYLSTLGPLTKPERRSQAGLRPQAPAPIIPNTEPQ